MTELRSSDPTGEAEYALETALHCHLCHQEISSVMIVRLLRTRVDFVSTLPRRGYVIVCSRCHGILSVGLS